MFEESDDTIYKGRIQFIPMKIFTKYVSYFDGNTTDGLVKTILLVAHQNNLDINVGEMILGSFLMTYVDYTEDSLERALDIIMISTPNN
jgi:hypothetical protein